MSVALAPVSWASQYDFRLSSSTEAGWTFTTAVVRAGPWLSYSHLAAGLERMTGAGAVPVSDVHCSLSSSYYIM